MTARALAAELGCSVKPIFGLFKNMEEVQQEAFYTDSFHCGIPHEDLLKNIMCKTIFMKAKTNVSEDGILMAALSEEDLKKVSDIVADCKTIRFDCGHGIHIEKPKEFIKCLIELTY